MQQRLQNDMIIGIYQLILKVNKFKYFFNFFIYHLMIKGIKFMLIKDFF